ncbi:hypothetical protein ACI65C_008686 [Semiaphis heraclei]
MDKFVFKISKNDDDRSTTDDQKSTPTLTSLDTKCKVAPSKLQDIIQMQANNKHDIGLFLGKSVDNTLKYEMLMSPWNPCSAYDFKADIGVVAPSLTKLCVTRWSESHKALRKYYENFLLIVEALEYLKVNANKDTSLKATCHLNSVTTSQFIVCLRIIAKYSATIEPITNSLQGINCDLFSANKHIKDLIKYISDDRANNEEMFLILMKDINMYLNELGITLMTPRVSSKQTLRNNPPSSGPEDYYRKSIYIPYLDSLITSLNERFPEDNSKYEIISVHPKYLKQTKKEEFIIQLQNLKSFYGEFIENIEEEGLVWYNMWKEKNDDNMDFLKLLDEVTFLPSIKKCILIAATLPSTTCSVERSFSSLKRLKTWLRSTVTENRLNGLALMNIYKTFVQAQKSNIIDEAIKLFAMEPRRMQFLFNDQ